MRVSLANRSHPAPRGASAEDQATARFAQAMKYAIPGEQHLLRPVASKIALTVRGTEAPGPDSPAPSVAPLRGVQRYVGSQRFREARSE